MKTAAIRVVPAVYHPKGTDRFIPSIRFIDPDVPSDDDNAEFFTVDVKHLEALIDRMRKAAAEAVARAEQLDRAGPEDRALAFAPSVGRA